jgi:hypothetical protein
MASTPKKLPKPPDAWVAPTGRKPFQGPPEQWTPQEIQAVRRQQEEWEQQAQEQALRGANPLARYRTDPVGYAQDRLGVYTLTTDQKKILQSLVIPPYRTLVKAGHEVGKTVVAAVALNWHFDCFQPSITMSTAPNFKQVKDVLWKEVRRLRTEAGLGDFVGPKVPRLEKAPNHFAVGVTANTAADIQGQHGPAVFGIIEEAVGVERDIWDAFIPMCHRMLCIFNPTDTTSAAYQEETQAQRPYTVLTMSQLDHPNIHAYFAGKAELPIPHAVKPWDVDVNLRAWSNLIAEGQQRSSDVQWPPAWAEDFCRRHNRRPLWYRPGPLAESKILGRWPSQGTYGVWSDGDWEAACRNVLEPRVEDIPEIGCDVARFGDDWTEIHARCGPVSLLHEAGNGWSTAETAGHIKAMCRYLAEWYNARQPGGKQPLSPQEIPCKIDDTGVGGGVTDQAGGFAFIGVNGGQHALDQEGYPNARSELWFVTSERARNGQLYLGRLPEDVRRLLRQQAMAVTWKMDGAGRRVVERKDETKETIGRSPDGLDALNLSFYAGRGFLAPAVVIETPQHVHEERVRDPFAGRESSWRRRGLFGYRG